MKRIQTLSVDLINYDTFEAQAFEATFKAFQGSSRSHFEFLETNELEKAIKELVASKLDYKLYHKIALESEEELKNYPAVYISFNSPKYPVIDCKNSLWSVNLTTERCSFFIPTLTNL
ncbi:MAG: hypothetical protein ACRBFS_04355 [Aureispira sp.]